MTELDRLWAAYCARWVENRDFCTVETLQRLALAKEKYMQLKAEEAV